MKNSRNYYLLLAGQFLGAFGDNAILMVLLGPLMVKFHSGQISGETQSLINIILTSILFIPYVLLAPLAGYLNDRYAKTHWLLLGNAIKLAGTAVCLAAHDSTDLWRGVGYFIVGVGSCVYSPAKYGILPEILPTERLVKANGSVELLTLIAILTGTIGGSIMVDRLGTPTCFVVIFLIYGASIALNLLMDTTPGCPSVKLGASAQEFFLNLRDLLTHKRLSRALIGTSLFWFCGAMMKMNFQPWGQQVLGFQTMTQVSLLGLWLSVGVMIGSVAAGQFYKIGDLDSTRKFGLCLAASLVLLGCTRWIVSSGFTHTHALAVVVLILAGIAAGLFLIPLNAALQAESHHGKMGKTIATQNCLENIAMLAGSLFAVINVTSKLDPSQLFLGLAAVVGVVAALLRIPPRTGETSV